jgi:hypothetical protein
MRPRRVAVVAVVCVTASLAVWGAAGLADFASPDFQNTSRLLVEDRRAISVPAEPMASPQATAMPKGDVSVSDVATALPVGVGIETALPDLRPLPPEAPPVQMATASTPDPVQKEAKGASELHRNARRVPSARNLHRPIPWSLYERRPRSTPQKVVEQIKVTVKKNGKPTRHQKLQSTSTRILRGRTRRRQKKPACR